MGARPVPRQADSEPESIPWYAAVSNAGTVEGSAPGARVDVWLRWNPTAWEGCGPVGICVVPPSTTTRPGIGTIEPSPELREPLQRGRAALATPVGRLAGYRGPYDRYDPAVCL